MNYLISNNYLKVTISSFGAEPISIIRNNKERLWQNDNGTWNRHAPILFPHAGIFNIIINGKNYKSEKHGFLRNQEFEIINIKENKIELSFKSNEISKQIFPYNFEFIATYELKDFSLIITYKIINTSNTPIYFSLGCHESFTLDDDIKNYYIVFEKTENLISIAHTKEDNLGTSNIIDLATPLLENSDSIILHNIKSREASIYDKRNNMIIAKTCFDDFPNFLLWHSPGSKMICMEPWLNLPDKSDEDKNKEFKDKENVIKLDVNSTKEFNRTIYYY